MTFLEEFGPCTDRAGTPDSYCPSKHPKGYRCTRVDGHAGRHEAGIEDFYVATWDDEDEERDDFDDSF